MKISFQSCVLLSLARNGKGGATASFSSSLTDSVCSAMGWAVPSDCFTSATPEGELQCESVELVPAQQEMRKHSVSIGVARVSSFELLRREMEGKRGKGHTLELRFKVSTSESGICARLERYMETIGQGKGKMAVSYQKQAQQEDLPIQDEERAEATAKEND